MTEDVKIKEILEIKREFLQNASVATISDMDTLKSPCLDTHCQRLRKALALAKKTAEEISKAEEAFKEDPTYEKLMDLAQSLDSFSEKLEVIKNLTKKTIEEKKEEIVTENL